VFSGEGPLTFPPADQLPPWPSARPVHPSADIVSCVLSRVPQKEKWQRTRGKHDRPFRMPIAVRVCCRCCLLREARTWWHAQRQRVVSYLPKHFERHTARETNNTHNKEHTPFRVGMRPHVELNPPYKASYTPSFYWRGRPDTTGIAGDPVVDKCMVGYNVKRGYERRLSMGRFVGPRLAP
jgi:hypothetical protein